MHVIYIVMFQSDHGHDLDVVGVFNDLSMAEDIVSLGNMPRMIEHNVRKRTDRYYSPESWYEIREYVLDNVAERDKWDDDFLPGDYNILRSI